MCPEVACFQNSKKVYATRTRPTNAFVTSILKQKPNPTVAFCDPVTRPKSRATYSPLRDYPLLAFVPLPTLALVRIYIMRRIHAFVVSMVVGADERMQWFCCVDIILMRAEPEPVDTTSYRRNAANVDGVTVDNDNNDDRRHAQLEPRVREMGDGVMVETGFLGYVYDYFLDAHTRSLSLSIRSCIM